MRRLLPCIALALAAGLQGCTTLTGEPAPARGPGALGEELARAEAHFRGRWYVLDRNMSCLQDKTVTFADGKATFDYFPGGGDGGTDQPSGGGPERNPATQPLAVATGAQPLTLPYHFERDSETGLEALVVERPDGEDRFWMAGPDFLLALNDEGYEVMAHCD
ncbi:MAG: hypothetical protein IRY94_02105 [Rhodospirillaceae bacterium]|nr:hypothetical protein [Rhodospirillaceae bacterium]